MRFYQLKESSKVSQKIVTSHVTDHEIVWKRRFQETFSSCQMVMIKDIMCVEEMILWFCGFLLKEHEVQEWKIHWFIVVSDLHFAQQRRILWRLVEGA